MTASNKINYTGKMIYVGLDVHKKSYAVTCLCEGTVAKKVSMDADMKGLGDFLLKYFDGASAIYTAYEAGFSGFGLHRYLESRGIKNSVVHAASIEISSRDRVKTDKRDSLKIATQLAAGRLKGIRIPSEEEESERVISRTRGSLSNTRRRIGQQIKSKLYEFNLIAADDERHITEKWLKEIEKMTLPKGLKIGLDGLIALWRECMAQIRKLDKIIDEASAERPAEKVYQSVPGIGPVHSRMLADELGDLQQFENEKKLFSFTGLTPTESSSGESVRRGHISHQGRSQVRKALVEAAWVAVDKKKGDKGLKNYFEKLSGRTGKKRAIVAVARKLIGRIRACFASGELYKVEYKKIAAVGVVA